MTPNTILERALLGLVSLGPQSGYDVKRIFESSAMGQFSSSPGAIYPALRRLESRGLLRSESENPDRVRARRAYFLTEKGEAALTAWLTEPVTVEELRNRPAEPFLRLTFAEGRLSGREILDYLHGFRHAAEAFTNELAKQRDGFAAEGAVLPALVLEHGVGGYRATVRWIEMAERLLHDTPDLIGVIGEVTFA